MPKVLCRTARPRRGRTLLLVLPVLLAAAAAAAYWLRPRPDGNTTQPAVPATPPAPLCDGWESPAAVLVLTGEQHGILEPCGCTERQTGGLERRADLVRQLREERGWNVAALDLGGALHPERVTRLQERMKFETTRAALREMHYDAMAWGPEEVRLKAGTLYDIYQAEDAAGDTTPPFVCANVLLFGVREEMPTPLEYRMLTVGTEKIAVTAVVGESEWKRLFPEGAGVETTEFGFETPATALARVLPLMDAEHPTLRVLLAHAPVAESTELAKQFPQFDLVVTAGGNEDGAREPEIIGETWLLRVGRKGKHAGVVGLFREGDALRRKFELASLDKDRFAKSPQIHELLRHYVERLGSERPDRTEPGLEVGHPTGESYVGAEQCGACHRKAYAAWSKSSHSHAYESLETGGIRAKEGYLVRIFDAECLCCHTTGWNPQTVERYRSGFVDAETTPHLAGQQCENCHGPGDRHVELEQAWSRQGGPLSEELVEARRRLQRTKDAARKELCIQCHDADNSPTFDTDEKPFDTYWWPKVAHPGKD